MTTILAQQLQVTNFPLKLTKVYVQIVNIPSVQHIEAVRVAFRHITGRNRDAHNPACSVFLLIKPLHEGETN